MGVFLDNAKRDTVDLWKRLQQQAEETILSGLDRSATADIAQEERMAAKRRDASRGEIVSQINAGATKLQTSLTDHRQNLQRVERKPPPDERAKYDWFTDEYYQEKLDEWNRSKQTIRDQIDDMQAGINYYNNQKGKLQATWDSLTSNMMTKIPSIVGPNIDPAAVAAARARGRQILAQDLEKYDPDMLSLVDPEMAAFVDVRKRIDQGGPETLQEIMDSPSYKNVLFGGESGDTAAMADYYESGGPAIDISNIDQFLRQYGLGGTAPAAEDAMFGGGGSGRLLQNVEDAVDPLLWSTGTGFQTGMPGGAAPTDDTATTDDADPYIGSLLAVINEKLIAAGKDPVRSLEEFEAIVDRQNSVWNTTAAGLADKALYNRIWAESGAAVGPKPVGAETVDVTLPSGEIVTETIGPDVTEEPSTEKPAEVVPEVTPGVTGSLLMPANVSAAFSRAANEMRLFRDERGMPSFPDVSKLIDSEALSIADQIMELRSLHDRLTKGRLSGVQSEQMELSMINQTVDQLRQDVELEQRQLEAQRNFELASSRLSLDIAKSMEEGRQFDSGLQFQYRQAQSDLDQANRAMEMSAWQTAVENPFNVAAMNMLSGQNVFAPERPPTDAFQQALGPQQGNVQRYNEQGQLVTMTDPELELMQQRMLANPNRPMFSGQGFDTPVTREQFGMAYNQLLQRGMTPMDAATALGMGPDQLRLMQEMTTPGVRPRAGGGVPPSMGLSPFAGAFSSAPSGVGGFTSPPPAFGAPQQGAPQGAVGRIDPETGQLYRASGPTTLNDAIAEQQRRAGGMPQDVVSGVGSLGAIPQPLQNIGFQIPEQARFGQGLGIKNFFAGGTPTVADISNLPSVSRGLLGSVGEATGTTREDLMTQARAITPTTVGGAAGSSVNKRLSPGITRLLRDRRGAGAY